MQEMTTQPPEADEHAYRIIAKIKNNRLWTALRLQWPDARTQADMSRRVGFAHAASLGSLLSIKRWPGCRRCQFGVGSAHHPNTINQCDRGWWPDAWRVADAVRSTPEYLFEPELYGQAPQTITLTLDRPALEATGMLALPSASPETLVLDAEEARARIKALEEALTALTPRERWVLRLRFGLDNGDEHSTKEIGSKLMVTTHRICAIEAKAFRKLRYRFARTRIKE